MQVLLSDWTLKTAFTKIAHYIAYGFYWVLAKLAQLCNLIINLVRALAGLETYWYNGTQVNPGESGQGDIVINFIQEQGLINIFIALFVLSIVLLFIVTLVSVIKSEWSPVTEAKGNNKYAVISKSIRALINFITVPVVSILGIIVGNELLKAFDGATHNGEGDIGISNLMMQCVTENASWVYINDSDARKIMEANEGTVDVNGQSYKGIYSHFTTSGGYDAAAINRAFNQGAKVPTDLRVSVENIPWLTDEVAEAINDKIARGEAYFSYQDVDMVSIFYKLGNVDYLAGFVVMFFVTKFLFEISFGLVKRIYMLSILILISPPIVAVTPLQPDALKNWRKQFISNVLSVYGAIVGCNLYFILVPYMRRIQLFKNSDILGYPINSFITLLFIGAGAMFIGDFSKLITDIIGGGDLRSQSVDKNGNSLWKSVAKNTGGAISAVAGAPSRAISSGLRFGQDIKYQGWSQASKNAKDSVKNNIMKQSGFLQGLTGAKVDKDGSVKGVGSSFVKGISGETSKIKQGIKEERKKQAEETLESTRGGIATQIEQKRAEADKKQAELDRIQQHQAVHKKMENYNPTDEEKAAYDLLKEVAEIEEAEQQKLLGEKAKLDDEIKALEAQVKVLDSVKVKGVTKGKTVLTSATEIPKGTSKKERQKRRQLKEEAKRNIAKANEIIVQQQAIKQAVEDANKKLGSDDNSGDSSDS